jgi:dihydroorotate dehydrogenase (fumarate)
MDLATKYLGLELRNPIVASAGPLSQSVDGIRALAGGGVGAVVLYSLFEEEMRREAERSTEIEDRYEDMFGEASSFFPSREGARRPTLQYLRLIEQAAGVVDIPVIGSLNGVSVGSWIDTARQMQDAGAAAVELNIYFVPGDLETSGRLVEHRHLEIVAAVKESVDIPVAVKLSPYFSSTGEMCLELDRAGVDGLVLFNRFLQPDIDIERIKVVPGVTLSRSDDARLARTWIAILRGRLRGSLAATSGVADPDDVVKYLLAGADVVMTTSALIRHGAAYAHTLLEGLEDWLTRHELTLDAARGLLAVPEITDANAYERWGYVEALQAAKSVYGSLA